MSTIPARREGESLADWQTRAMESATAWHLCLAITRRGTLCTREAGSCGQHRTPSGPVGGGRLFPGDVRGGAR